MEVFKRKCIQNWFAEDAEGNRQDIHQGKEYFTLDSPSDGTVIVFATFWVRVPASIFAPKEEE